MAYVILYGISGYVASTPRRQSQLKQLSVSVSVITCMCVMPWLLGRWLLLLPSAYALSPHCQVAFGVNLTRFQWLSRLSMVPLGIYLIL